MDSNDMYSFCLISFTFETHLVYINISIVHSCSSLRSITVFIYTTSYLLTYLLVNIQVIYSLVIKNNASVFKLLNGHMLFFLIVSIYLTSYETTQLFFKMALSSYNLHCVWELQLFQAFASTHSGSLFSFTYLL